MLAFNMLLCYAGICEAFETADTGVQDMPSHCEMSGMKRDDNGEAAKVDRADDAGAGQSLCCLETLRNSPTEDNLSYPHIVTAFAYYNHAEDTGRSDRIMKAVEKIAHGPPPVCITVTRLLL